MAHEFKAKLVRVVDGDTIDADIDLGFDISVKKRIRFLGINTPESRTRDLEEKKRLQEKHLLEIRRRNEADRLEVQYQRIKMLQQASSEGSSKPKQKKYRTKPKLNGNNRIRSSYQMAGLIPLNMDAFAHLDRDKEVTIIDD